MKINLKKFLFFCLPFCWQARMLWLRTHIDGQMSWNC